MHLHSRRSLGIVVLAFALSTTGVAHAAMNAHGSALQVWADGLSAKAPVSLLNSAGAVIRTRKVNGLGGVLFRNVKPGAGYRVRSGSETSAALTVFSNRPAPPSTDVYKQDIKSQGYQYLTTRDGTKLAINVHPPTDVGAAVGAPTPPDSGAPQPTLIEYSGYGYANPDGAESSIGAILNGLGFTVVDVNMRGTGCSGGSFDFFEPLQGLDGYDVIETIARQPWVAHNKVGMMGISYGGISQLFTAEDRPPSLSAIAPLSVIDMTQTTLYPGGILNTGFAFAWTKERVHDAKPAGPKQGQAWAYKRVQNGDAVCKANQAMHPEAANLIKKVRSNSHYVPKVADPLAPVKFVHKINVPVFMACQFTDEQTGGHCPTLAAAMTGTKKKWFTFVNGTHIDSLDPETFNRWFDFLMLYVAQQAPITGAARAQGAAPVVYQVAMGISGLTLPNDDPVQQQPTYDGALALYEKYPSIRVLFDSGAGRNPGEPYPGFEHSWPSWPIPGTQARTWFVSPKGVLADKAPAATGSDSFTWNPKATPATDFTGDTAAGTDGLWTATPPYKWQQKPAGTSASYMTNPLTQNTTVVGAGSVWLWVKAPKPVVDLQVTVTEVRPDGKETFVQGGWLKSSFRKLDPALSTPLDPWPSGRLKDLRKLPRNRFVQIPIPLYYEGHAYRKGSRIRVIVSAPNGDQPIWSFGETVPKGTTKVTIGHGPKMPSRLMLPVVPGVDVTTPLPPCPGLRGEPCRDFKG